MPEKPGESNTGLLAFAMALHGVVSIYSIWSGNQIEFY